MAASVPQSGSTAEGQDYDDHPNRPRGGGPSAGTGGYVSHGHPAPPFPGNNSSASGVPTDRGERHSHERSASAAAIGPAEDRLAAAAAAGGGSGGPVANPSSVLPMSNYAFFVKYTYSNECALLAYNFHELVTKLGIFEQFAYRHDHRLISVTLAYIFYRYQVHHCDMALDLAVTLVYLEDVRALGPGGLELQENSRDAFNLICYLAFLAHAFNADRTIRLSDWYKEIGWRSFKSCQQLNGYVFFLFSQVRRYRLRVSETRVKRYIQKLCSVPTQVQQ